MATRLAERRQAHAERSRLPEVPQVAVERRRLLTLLDLAARQRVTLVVAPPGYGKTVLLSQWAAARPRRRICWLTLRSDHDNAARLGRELCTALEHPLGSPAADIARWVDPSGDQLGVTFVDALLSELDNLPPTTLLLDDFHRLSNHTLQQELGTIIDHGPRSLHVVIASRIDPPLAYYRWRLSDALVELRQEDLAFTSDEAAPLVRKVTGHDLPADQIDALVRRTEGWAVGLHLAGLALRERSDPDAFVETIASPERHVGDYLTEEVLRHQPEQVRRFLLATSVLEQMSGPLCEYVTGHPLAQTMLEDLDRTSMFVTRVNGPRGWFRYHELFHGLLRHHLRDEDPKLERQLLVRAAEWHRRRGDIEVAARYLLEAQDWQQVLELVVAQGPAMLRAGDANVVAEWIEQVPRSLRKGRVDIALLEAAGRAVGGDVNRADAVLAGLEGLQPMLVEEQAVTELLRAYCAIQRGALREGTSRAEQVLRVVDGLDETLIPNPLGLTRSRAEVRAGANLIRGIGLVYEGLFDDARRSLEPAVAAGHAFWQISALGALAVLEAWSGALRAAETAGTAAVSLAGQLGLDHQAVSADAYLALARVARERDQLDRATDLVEELMSRLPPNRRPSITASAVTEQARLALAKGQPEAGLVAIAARRASEHHALPAAVLARRAAAEAQLLIANGDFDAAARVVSAAPALVTLELASARMRLAVERGDLEGAHRIVDAWPERPEPRAGRELELWRGVLANLGGDERTARDHVSAAVTSAEPDGDIGVFRAAGHHVLGPARSLYRAAPTPFLRGIVECPYAVSPIPKAQDLVEQLTEREVMVLALLPQHLSTAEIAERLDVSLNTVKTHLKHIYRKFGVANRSAAVDAAECMHIL